MSAAPERKILLVEDEALIAMSERMILEQNGYDVTVAHSGPAAIEVFAEDQDIDLVLMDIDLGSGMDGTEAAQAILAGDRGQDREDHVIRLHREELRRNGAARVHQYEVFPDLPQKWRDVHKRSLQGEVVSAEDDIYERANGQVLWTRWECRPWYENDGSIGGIIINTEITDRTQRLQRLFVDNRDYLRTLLETALEGFCVVDSHGRILEVNSRYAELTGYGREELTAKSVWDVDAIDDESDAAARMQRIRDEGRDTFATRLRRKDGSLVNVRVSVSLISRESPSFVAFFLPTDGAAPG